MTPNIPPQLAASIQKYFNADDSSVAQISKELDGVLKWKHPLRVDWATIREGIATEVLPDDTIVTRLSDCITTFLRNLMNLLQSDTNYSNFWSHFRRTFVSGVGECIQIHVLIHPHPNGAMPFTRLNASSPVLELYLPRLRAGYASNIPFGDDLEECVNAGVSSLDPASYPGSVPTTGHEHGVGSPTIGTSLAQSRSHDRELAHSGHQHPSVNTLTSHRQGTQQNLRSGSWEIPTAASLPSPSQILKRSPIYIRITESYTGNSYLVEGCKPVIDLLADYLTLHSTCKPKAGIINWRTEVEVEGCSQVFVNGRRSAILLASVLEGSLGFEHSVVVVGTDRSLVWLFRRDAPGDTSGSSHQNPVFAIDNRTVVQENTNSMGGT